MSASRKEIDEWFDKGVTLGKSHMLIMCDTFDWEDYPKYVSNAIDAIRESKFPGKMQKCMEVYNLSMNKTEQINKYRVFNI